MSSVYRPICLSHDPALELEHIGWQSGSNGHDILTAALASPGGRGDLEPHAGCELVGGRFSYPLIEVYCPPVTDKTKHPSGCYHPHDGEWIDAKWLRLLLTAHDQQAPSDALFAAVGACRGCWPIERLTKLRGLL